MSGQRQNYLSVRRTGLVFWHCSAVRVWMRYVPIKSENRGNSGGCSREDVNAGSGEPFFHVMPAAGIRLCFTLWILKAGMRPGLCR